MKIKVLASGSKGNCTYLETDNAKILIDVGITYNVIKKNLSDISVNINDIDGIILTHTHTDHIKGLPSLIKKEGIPLYTSIKIAKEIINNIPKENINLIKETFTIKDLLIESFQTSHDCVDSYGYKISNNEKAIIYVTDTGYINSRYFNKISNADLYIIESNHDEEMLLNGEYPFKLKQRVISDEGHLSNNQTAKCLESLVGKNTKYVILAHLSENNNTEELAFNTNEKTIKKANKTTKLMIAKQYEALELIEV